MNDTLQAFLKLIQDLPSRKEFVDAFANVVDRVKRFETKLTGDFNNLVTTINVKVDAKISRIKEGSDGRDGRNPLTVSATPPKDPKTGDLWYQP